jgi:DNA-binding NtrC family response regulator
VEKRVKVTAGGPNASFRLVEQPIRNQRVIGPSQLAGSVLLHRLLTMPTGTIARTLLIVDDLDDYLRALALALAADWRVVCAKSANEAKTAVEAHRPDAALIDVRLSETDRDNREGLDVVAWLRDRDGSIPVVVMSAYRDGDATAEALRLGARAFVKKPLDLRSLKTLLEAVSTHT